MRLIISLSFFISYSISCHSQNFKFFDYDYKPSWSQWQSDPVTSDFLESNFDVFKNTPYSLLDDLIMNNDKYHFFDIDGDDMPELIYNGWNGGEGEMVVIYKKQDGRYTGIQRFFGRIMDISKTPSNHIRFIVFDYACCMGYIDHLETYDYNKYLKEFEMVESLAKNSYTDIPSIYIEPTKFKINNTPYNLRFSPEIKTGISKNQFDFEPIMGQNIAAIYKEGDTGTAYAESTDETGRVWWFVVMDKKPDNVKSLFYEGNNKFLNYKPIGWISSKYVEVID